jgi:hypothetical protein
MAKNRREIGILCAALLCIAACQQQAAPTQTPTQASTPEVPTETPIPTATPITRATLPPSWTPIFSPTPSITLTPSITPTPTKTYTPSETPTITPTWTLTYTPTPNATNLALLSQPLADECRTFGADPIRNGVRFPGGTAPTVVWTPVDTAAAYQIRLYDSNQVTLATHTTTETEYEYSAELFQLNQTYAWEVAPVDADGVQLCPARGALLIPVS